MAAKKICDFCDREVTSADNVRFFPTNAFFIMLLGIAPIYAEKGAWGACPRCEPFVSARNLGGLAGSLPSTVVGMDLAAAKQMHAAAFGAIRWEDLEYVYGSGGAKDKQGRV